MAKRPSRTHRRPRAHAPALGLGEAALAQQRFGEAAEIFATVLAVAPRHPDALVGRAEAARRRSLPGARAQRDALAAAEAARERAPNNARAWLAYAYAAGRVGQWSGRNEALARLGELLAEPAHRRRFPLGAALRLGLDPVEVDACLQDREPSRSKRPSRLRASKEIVGVLAPESRRAHADRLADALRGAGSEVMVVQPKPIPDDEMAREISRLKVGVLIDLAGWDDDGRPGVLAARPAPLQLHLHGYPGSLGPSRIDAHFATSDLCNGFEPFLEPTVRETVGPLLCKEALPAARPRGALGLPETGRLWAAWAPWERIPSRRFQTWCEGLRTCPDALLWLVGGTPEAENALRENAEQQGVAPHRLVFSRPETDLVVDLQHAELALDVPTGYAPFVEASVRCELPIVVDAGEHPAHRESFALVRLAGGEAEPCSNEAGYLEAMLELERTPGAADRQRAALARRKGAAYDARGQAERLLALIAEMKARLAPPHCA